MPHPVDHVLLTRFNLPSAGHESLVRARENWLRDRVALFDSYCLPSVRAQSCRDFSWLIYFDPESPDWLRDWVRSHEDQGDFTPLFRESVSREQLLADIRAVLGRPHRDQLLTTNLDNDDSIAGDLVARLQEAAGESERTAVYVGDGLIARDGELYRRLDPHNAFCSVRESWTAPVTCWSDWHNRLPRSMPALVLRGQPGWLQVVHGGNVSNRVRGRRTRPSAYRQLFPGLLDGLPEPSAADLVTDTLIGAPSRALRETGRAAAKTAVGAVLGRRGLDRAKVLWASTRRAIG